MIEKRIRILRERMKTGNVEAIWISKPENRYYLSGFTGTSGFLFLLPSQAVLLTDFRYLEQAQAECPDWEVIRHGTDAVDELAEIIRQHGVETLGIEKDFLTVRQYEVLQKKLSVHFCEISEMLAGMREIKDESEIISLETAARLADQAFQHITTLVKPGISEGELSLELEFFMRRQGASGPSFDFIVASGARSALPHGVAGEKVLETGDFVTMDFGCVYDGYHSDITRTVVVGGAGQKQKDLYHLLQEVQETALEEVRPGIRCRELDEVARSLITRAGFGNNFGHGLGHGVGLEIHENPRVGAGSETVLQSGMVITVEPGIYLPGWGGVRIEDMVLVTSEGCRVMTHSPKELLEI